MKKFLLVIAVLVGLVFVTPTLITNTVVTKDLIKNLIEKPGKAIEEMTLEGAKKNTNKADLIGSASNYVSLPISWVEANSTTTDAGSTTQLEDGGSTITQYVDFRGANLLRLSGGGKADTATSTANLTFMGSNDGDDWFYITNASTTETLTRTALSNSTTTPSLYRSAYVFDFGLTSTTFSYVFEIPVIDYLRVMWYGEDLSADPNDGVQVWLEAVKQVEL